MSPLLLNTQEIHEWRNTYLTQRVISMVREERKRWTEQSCVGALADDSHRLACFRDGVIAGLGFILDLGVDDGEQDGNE